MTDTNGIYQGLQTVTDTNGIYQGLQTVTDTNGSDTNGSNGFTRGYRR